MTAQPESKAIDEPYVYVIYAAAASDTRIDDPDLGEILLEELARRGIPVSPDYIFDPDTTSFDDEETSELVSNAAAVLVLWSTDADDDLLSDAFMIGAMRIAVVADST